MGCVLSAAWSKLGFNVVGFDYSNELIDDLNQNKPPIFEPDMENMLKASRNEGRLKFTNEINLLKDRDFIFLAYDTTVLDNDESDLTLLKNAINGLKKVMKQGAVVVVSSQSPVGMCKIFREQLQKEDPDLDLVYSPENLRLVEAINCYLDPGRIIIGGETEPVLSKVKALFNNIDGEIITMNLSSSEMVKHGINSFLAMSITFANNLSELCEVTGANINSVIKGMKSDQRIGLKAYLTPGIGYSGPCLKILKNINNRFNKKADIFENIYKFNSKRKYSIIDKIKKLCDNNLKSRKIGILGVTYKPGTSTLRRSLPMEIVEILGQEECDVAVFDPKANYDEYLNEKKFIISKSIPELMKRSGLIILLTEWPEFRSINWREYLIQKIRKLYLILEIFYMIRGYQKWDIIIIVLAMVKSE